VPLETCHYESRDLKLCSIVHSKNAQVSLHFHFSGSSNSQRHRGPLLAALRYGGLHMSGDSCLRDPWWPACSGSHWPLALS
jgi:hypothetical protein